MNTSHDDTSKVVTSLLVPDAQRIGMLPKHFGRYFLTVENMIYGFARYLVPTYRGGYWQFYELSNGGFYMAPDIDASRLCVDNGFDETLSADAIGITVCLFTFSHGSFVRANASEDVFVRHYHLLREFASHHVERELISAAID